MTSTFDEELYTTKLERGPRTRELEEQAVRIAREIECENTRDLHVAEVNSGCSFFFAICVFRFIVVQFVMVHALHSSYIGERASA